MRAASILLLLCGATAAQQSLVEPEMADIFYRLDQNKLVALERQSAAIKGGAHGFIVMSMKTASEFPGAKSPIRFKAGERFELVVRSMMSVTVADPNNIFCLRKLNPKKKSRELVMMAGHVSPLGASSTITPAQGVLPVEFSQYGNSSLKMVTGPLTPGEYAVGKPYGPAVFCFGIDK